MAIGDGSAAEHSDMVVMTFQDSPITDISADAFVVLGEVTAISEFSVSKAITDVTPKGDKVASFLVGQKATIAPMTFTGNYLDSDATQGQATGMAGHFRIGASFRTKLTLAGGDVIDFAGVCINYTTSFPDDDSAATMFKCIIQPKGEFSVDAQTYSA